jgi:hypothetical protein
MTYKNIKDFNQRCEEHPDHQTGMISHGMIQQRLQEEIDELREYIEAKQEQRSDSEQLGEPVAWMSTCDVGFYKSEFGDTPTVPLYTTPQPAQKPLTDEAIATVYWGATGQSLRPQDNVLAHNFARAIEAAHGIKE